MQAFFTLDNLDCVKRLECCALTNWHLVSSTQQSITEDDVERLYVCLRVLSEQSPLMAEVFGEQSRSVFAKMLHIREQEASADKKVILFEFLPLSSSKYLWWI